MAILKLIQALESGWALEALLLEASELCTDCYVNPLPF